MRVTGGELGGRRLVSPPAGVRPTSDRVREALFARLGDLAQARVLDLYAGTGTLGIEALSRGAARAVFVERSAASLRALRRNLDALALSERTRVVRGDVRSALGRLARDRECFDLVLADPPYAEADVASVLAGLARGGLLASDAVVVVERGRRHPVASIEGLVSRDTRRYGDTTLEWFERVAIPRTGPRAAEGEPQA